MWTWLKRKHPIIYEVISWGVLLIATITLIHEFF